MDVNDQNKGYAFNSVLRVTQDSIQEFRVNSALYGADHPRTLTAQHVIDEIRGIEGIFSGTLAYLFNIYDGSTPFSAIVRDAKGREFSTDTAAAIKELTNSKQLDRTEADAAAAVGRNPRRLIEHQQRIILQQNAG